jgi:hypothetical protein
LPRCHPLPQSRRVADIHRQALEEGNVDYISEAKKFIQRARDASHREVINQQLAMADWYLSEAIKERDQAEASGPQRIDFKISGLPPMKA